MNKIEQMHLDCISEVYLDSFDEGGHTEMDCEKAASKSAEITEKIAIEFWAWMRENDTPDNAEQYGNYTDKDMFQEFLKTKQ